MVCDAGESDHFLQSKKGITQGGPLAIITYGIGILLIIHKLYNDHLHVMQTCYADDEGDGGNFAALCNHLEELMVRGPPRDMYQILPRASWLYQQRKSLGERPNLVG